jgi:5-carboxymethyl-2-hydroxymuconate isomerase
MPHIILEYSQDSVSLNTAKKLVHTAFEAVKLTGLFKTENIKARLHPVEIYQLGLPDSGFMHVMCRIHPGKTPEQKMQLTQTILSHLEAVLRPEIKAKRGLVITVEVIEMDRTKYAKVVL